MYYCVWSNGYTTTLYDETDVSMHSSILPFIHSFIHAGKLVLDGWVRFTAPARVGLLVRELRGELEALLREKEARPALDLAASPVIQAVLLLLRTNGI
jgi:hypothetical protein